MADDQDSGNTELVLPIICPHCAKEINLSMLFALLSPDPKTDDTPQEDTTA